MPAITRFRPGRPCWVDLLTSDPAAAQLFYGELFGWTFQQTGEPGVRIICLSAGARVAGITAKTPSPDVADAWIVSLSVTDAGATAAAITRNGGTVHDVAPAGDRGVRVVATDPGGARVDGWQAGTVAGFEREGEPGAPVWQEVGGGDYRGQIAFYEAAFGWETSVLADSDGFRFTTLGEGADAVAGIMDDPSAETARWTVYFGVADANAAAAVVAEHGGTILEEASDTPFGRLVGAADPTGAPFFIMQED
jgi:predicted enzyme related to lactoylglutathione lyase